MQARGPPPDGRTLPPCPPSNVPPLRWSPPRDNITHFVLAGLTRTCATSRVPCRSMAIAWARAEATRRALARAGRLHQEPRKVGPQRRPQKRQPSLGSHGGKSRRRQPTAGCAAGWNRPTRLELLDDLESRAIREVSGRRCRYGDAERRLPLHLTNTSRIVLLLWKGHESAH